MARFILKWRYLKKGQRHSKNLIRYIGTRNGVEKCDESWKKRSVTMEQEELTRELIKDFPDIKDSFEYQDYAQNKNRYTATQLITKAIDENIDRIGKRENYVKYIAMRPRVEKNGRHGLFSFTDEPISLNKVAEGVGAHDGAVWTMIFSLRRDDATRLGYDHAKAWKDLLRAHTVTLAKEMKISVEDLTWYGAFHNEGDHPHVHLVAYSKGKEPYMTRRGLERLKSKFTNEIFKQDLYHIYDEQTQVRDELRAEGKAKATELLERIQADGYEDETVRLLLNALADSLKGYQGKKVYGYLPKSAKNLVDGIVDELAKDERLKELYELWYKEKDKIVGIYQDSSAERTPLSQNKELKSIRNAVVREVFNIVQPRTEEVTPTSAVTRLFHHLSRMLQNSFDNRHGKEQSVVDRKLRKVIKEKKEAQGLKQG